MCGIFLSLELGASGSQQLHKRLEECLRRRGPDGEWRLTKKLPGSLPSTDVHVMHMHGTTLQLQGPMTLQPMVDDCGNALLWNGEIFAGGIEVSDDENDGMVLLERLRSCTSDEEVPSLLAGVKGPWSFVYWREESKSLFFGRDYLGRRSLLWNLSGGDHPRFSLSSIALRSLSPVEIWQEVPVEGIYMLPVSQGSISPDGLALSLYPWQPSREVPTDRGECVQTGTPPDCAPTALRKRVGVRSALPSPVAPLNKEIIQDCQVTEDELDAAAAQLIEVLGQAVKRRVTNVPMREKPVTAGGTPPDPASVAVLYSGGIDSIVLAALSDRFIPAGQPIDLLNVAFEKKRRQPPQKKTKRRPPTQEDSDPFLVPDRITGRSGLGELKALNPDRTWNLVEIDVTLEVLQAARQERIGDMVHPLNSVLDDSIGCAMWFAARGEGVLYEPGGTGGMPCYTSQAKVVLSGLGADEQLAGYARHRVHFNSDGWGGLLSQLEMELNRIPSRNMGRDDRIISDHGREARFPFLDEDVVSFLNVLPIHLKADLSLPRGEGEKRLLRVAARQMGLTDSTRLPKRAIQFGSRIAKLEDATQKASDICDRLILPQPPLSDSGV